MMINLSRHELHILLDALDLTLGSYEPEMEERIRERYAAGSDERKRVLVLIDSLSLALGDHQQSA